MTRGRTLWGGQFPRILRQTRPTLLEGGARTRGPAPAGVPWDRAPGTEGNGVARLDSYVGPEDIRRSAAAPAGVRIESARGRRGLATEDRAEAEPGGASASHL